MPGYREVANDLRKRVNAGEFPEGANLPRLTELEREYGASRLTLRRAVAILADEGLVVPVRKRGTVVRSRTLVPLPLSRYSRVIEPGGTKGPWETACAERGLDGRMVVDLVAPAVRISESSTRLLQLPAKTEAVYRRRLAMIGSDDVVQTQDAWYPPDIARDTPLSKEKKIEGGVYRQLIALGHRPAAVNERVKARLPTEQEAGRLRIGGRVPVFEVTRLTISAERRPLELLRVIAPADRVELVYDDLPLPQEAA
ncbi:GntR family transcriptional regulator [Streptomyces sp. MP131-18]|uniref:GntR family transcriptional regulator n=1 Tax=Streptomyces sp. MP131-18 TaxID=1857892 RepID=UPI00097C2CC7|nr:GntR family transcriptional regulator [Streptomyces sp. MP131-18]ONK09261.1 putative HTH-type transcriptional regulator YegW [Streptomyces sp. MP131-18]